MLVKLVRYLLKKAPDKLFLQLYFFKNMKRFINFRKPKTFNEKIQWMKVYDRNPLYIQIADKAGVRDYVREVLGEKYLIPIFGVFQRFDDIDFTVLPKQFVIKCTHDSGSVVVCRNKDTFDIDAARRKIERGMLNNSYDYAREWQYRDIKPQIIVEQYLEQEDGSGIIDYKFFCFNGEPRFFYVSQGLEDHSTARISFYDLQGQEMPFCRSDYRRFESARLPTKLEEMVRLAKKSAEAIGGPFIRADFYEIDGKIYFSEYTLHPCSGVMPFQPKQWDYTVGQWLQLP